MVSFREIFAVKIYYIKMIKTLKFFFWLNYSDKNNHLEEIPVALENIEILFCMTDEILDEIL